MSIFDVLWRFSNVIDITQLFLASKAWKSCLLRADEAARIWIQSLFQQDLPQQLPNGIKSWRQLELAIKLPLPIAPTAVDGGVWVLRPLEDLLLARTTPALLK